MGKFIDLTGQRFGKLVVKERAPNNRFGGARWLCQCDCGKQSVVTAGELKRGHAKSCGCVAIKHGDARVSQKTKLYYVWSGIKQRCENPSNKNHDDYGGRGIKMCPEWLENYSCFREWAYQSGYSEGLEIDRIDNDKGYFPENCHWVERKNNVRNTRTRKDSSSGVKGVWKLASGRYLVKIGVNGKQITVGRFDTFEEARTARFRAESEYWSK